MSTFALVPGAWHGAWCWERLVPELETLGHRALALDLPIGDLTKAHSHYATHVVELLADEDEDIVLVGHSLSGFTVPLVAARRPLRLQVYLAGLVPRPGVDIATLFSEEPVVARPELMRQQRHPDGWSWWEPDDAREAMYHDCSAGDAAWATSRLRPQARAASVEPCPLDALPDVPAAYVLCRDDRLVSADWVRELGAPRVGATVHELPGGHSPFVSRPRELAALLHTIAG
jgi:pimeloyl-ACP methyl ester carboxylesterase